MDGPLWYEDVERHRVPAVYYISKLDDESGPHLILDWNGTPIDLSEFDIDMASRFVTEPPLPSSEPEVTDKMIEEFHRNSLFANAILSKDCEARCNPANVPCLQHKTSNHLLTVPPTVSSLLQRQISLMNQNQKLLQRLRELQTSHAIPTNRTVIDPRQSNVSNGHTANGNRTNGTTMTTTTTTTKKRKLSNKSYPNCPSDNSIPNGTTKKPRNGTS